MTIQAERTSSRLGREAERHLEELLQHFDLWATSADRSDAGWESDFPQWPDLMRGAERLMAQEHQSEAALSLLGRCWALSEEDEDCAEWARGHLQETHVQELVRGLADDADWNSRWQAYDVLGSLTPLDDDARAALEKGLTDENAYARRRAFLSLLRHREADVQPYILQMLTDVDDHNRDIASREVSEADTSFLRAQAQAARKTLR